MPTMSSVPPHVPSNPSKGPSVFERMAITSGAVYVLKRIVEVCTMKGYRTLVVNGLLLLTYVLAWGPLTELVNPQYVSMATVVVNAVLRWVTTSPVGQSSPS